LSPGRVPFSCRNSTAHQGGITVRSSFVRRKLTRSIPDFLLVLRLKKETYDSTRAPVRSRRGWRAFVDRAMGAAPYEQVHINSLRALARSPTMALGHYVPSFHCERNPFLFSSFLFFPFSPFIFSPFFSLFSFFFLFPFFSPSISFSFLSSPFFLFPPISPF